MSVSAVFIGGPLHAEEWQLQNAEPFHYFAWPPSPVAFLLRPESEIVNVRRGRYKRTRKFNGRWHYEFDTSYREYE